MLWARALSRSAVTPGLGSWTCVRGTQKEPPVVPPIRDEAMVDELTSS